MRDSTDNISRASQVSFQYHFQVNCYCYLKLKTSAEYVLIIPGGRLSLNSLHCVKNYLRVF